MRKYSNKVEPFDVREDLPEWANKTEWAKLLGDVSSNQVLKWYLDIHIRTGVKRRRERLYHRDYILWWYELWKQRGTIYGEEFVKVQKILDENS